LLARDGTERPIDDSAAPIRDRGGRPIGVVLVFRDITERRRTERELEASRRRLEREAKALTEVDRRKDEFVAVLAHELRNPLAPIWNALHLIGRLDIDDAKLARNLQVIERQVQQVNRLVDDLLDASRIARGKIEVRRTRLDLTRTLREIVRDSRG